MNRLWTAPSGTGWEQAAKAEVFFALRRMACNCWRFRLAHEAMVVIRGEAVAPWVGQTCLTTLLFWP